VKRRERHFGAVAADPRPANRHLAATEDDFARHGSGPRCRPVRLVLVPRTADCRPIFFQHRGEHLQPRADGEFQKLGAGIYEQIDEGKMTLGR
jgi:hypothetical protein